MRPDEQLVQFLLDTLSVTRTYSGRSDLLEGVPDRHSFNRSEENQQLDLQRIITRLRRHRESLERFAQNIRQYLQPHEQNELYTLVKQLSPRSMVPSLRVAVPHRFDLQSVVDECLPRIEQHHGLIGFVVDSTCDRLVENLVERIKEEMLPFSEVCVRKLNSVDGIRPSDFAIKRIRQMRDTLRVQDIVCSAVVPDRTAVTALWSAVSGELGRDCPRRFVLLVMVHEATPPPPGMYTLTVPVFHRHHARAWWRDLVFMKHWPGTHLQDILAAYAAGNGIGEPLDMDTIYDDLTDAIDLLKHYDDEELFHAAWMGRR